MTVDILVVGGGVVGLATARHLKRLSPRSRVLLLEKAPRLCSGNSARSAALYRDLFSSATSRRLASSSISHYLGIASGIGLRPTGYLWTFDAPSWDRNSGVAAGIVAACPGSELLDRRAMGRFLPEGCLPGAVAAIFGPRCGSLSAMALAEHYARAFRAEGGLILEGREAGPPLVGPPDGSRFAGLRDSSGEPHETGVIVAAAGCWLQDLLGPAGLATAVYPKKRQLFTVRVPPGPRLYGEEGPAGLTPALILPSGIYVKPLLDKGLIVAGRADELGRAFELPYAPVERAAPEEAYFRAAIEPGLRAAFPALGGDRGSAPLELAASWAGHYDYHWPDRNPVIERVGDLVWVGGSSGSGIMKADAIGRVAAARALDRDRVELADGDIFRVEELSLRSRRVEAEGLVI